MERLSWVALKLTQTKAFSPGLSNVDGIKAPGCTWFLRGSPKGLRLSLGKLKIRIYAATPTTGGDSCIQQLCYPREDVPVMCIRKEEHCIKLLSHTSGKHPNYKCLFLRDLACIHCEM
ncbi:uncharacterized protein [Cherax quadricarinatus]|uniref:uncharacterized protein isoform X1 n=1 Tax=Cherax quadricarinatus TaxID=27406 RepID=UPI00387EE102